MTIETEPKLTSIIEPRITVAYHGDHRHPGRWHITFHLFDLDNREIILRWKDAVKLAKGILSIVKEA